MAYSTYKIRDKSTGKFWNGNVACCIFNDSGADWKNEAACLEDITNLIQYRNKCGNNNTPAFNPDIWEIVKFDLIPKESEVTKINDHCTFIHIKTVLHGIDSRFANFAEVMQKKGVFDKISYLILLKPGNNLSYITGDRIIEARSHLRQLGVKTRSFRESRGVFGMMDRTQALKARMTLDIDQVVDLDELRQKFTS